MSRLVRAVVARTPVPWELIVSDCSERPYSPNGDLEGLSYAANGEVRVIRDWPKTCYREGYNKAFRESRGEYVLFLNDDAEPMPGYAASAVDFMRSNQDVGLGMLYFAEVVPPYQWHTHPAGVPYANFGIISRELGDRLGWFGDGPQQMYGVDNRLSYEVHLAGLGVVGIPAARVWHHAVQDPQKVGNQRFREPDARALMEKYGPRMEEIRAVAAKFASRQGPRDLWV